MYRAARLFLPKTALLLLLALFSAGVWAVDTDGDGVNNSVDAFPNDVCASVDTDGDGMPNAVNCYFQGFESASFSPWVNQGWLRYFDSSSSHSGSYSAHVSISVLTLIVDIDVPVTLEFYSKITGTPTTSKFFINGVSQSLVGGSTWVLFSKQLTPGNYTLRWEGQYNCPSLCPPGQSFYLDDIRIGANATTALVRDTDDDNDGVPDSSDAFDFDPTESVDTDNDSIGNNADTDDDNDSVLDVTDNCPLNTNSNQLNTDGDAQGNVCDADDDNDGVPDSSDAFDFDPTESVDTDNDSIGNNADTDDDNDSVLDVTDNCPLNTNSNQLNTDGDAQGNVCDTDDDNDGVVDASDKFPLNAAASSDTDNDGFPGSWNAACDSICQSASGLILDNCPSTANADQLNADGDAQGDVCDTDYDNDGVSNTADSFPWDATRSAGNTNILYTFNGDSVGDWFGWSVSAAGDVNNDGYADVIVGAHLDDNNGSNSGSARVLSGANGTILYAFNGDGANDWFGYSVSGAGDVNNDGYADVIVGAYQDDNNGGDSGSARVLSGANGAILYTFNGDSVNDWFGYSVSGAGDVNNDGYADVIVGARADDNNGNDSGSARVLSGIDGSILYAFDGDSANDHFGYSVSGAGDVNNDGYADVIIGAPADNNNGIYSGSARVLSGIDGSILYAFDGDSANDYFGYSVSGAGDVNNDGYADVIVGAYGDDNNGGDSGSARVLSGANGAILYTFNGDGAVDEFGRSVSGAGDVNNDGYADVIVGAFYDDNNGTDSGSARVLSGKGLWTDTDGDGQNDAIDADDDGDGVPDVSDAFPLDVTESTDGDGDGVGNNGDNCPAISNASQTDTDGDGAGNACDNCRVTTNADQLDTDGNSFGDVCDNATQNGAMASDNFGSAIAMADMNNDGYDDLIIGSPGKDLSSNKKDVGEIKIISGSDGAVLNAFIGTKASARFGSALAVVEDQNSDGVPDLIVGSPLYDSSLTKNDNGKVELYSGADGSLLQLLMKGSKAGDQLGASVAVADIDNDGEPNLIVGAPRKDLPGLKDAGQVTVYSGINNTILYQRNGTQAGERFGAAIAVDEDLYQLLVGSPFYDVNNGALLANAGRVSIFNGADGVITALFTRDGSTAGNNFGSAVASFGEDLDDDTFNEWAVGSALSDPSAKTDAGKVEVFSGFNATAFVIVDGATAGDHFGAALATGDINNDDEKDLAIGSPLFDVPPVDAGRVEVLSGVLF